MPQLRDVTQEWDEILAKLPEANPYHTAAWGAVVSAVYGGTFRVFQLDTEPVRYVPVLVGGGLSDDSFSCGHIGYGGVLDQRDGSAVPVAQQRLAMREVARALGRPCQQLVTTARPAAQAEPVVGAELRHTQLVPLTTDPDRRWSAYTAGARQVVRKAVRAGTRVEPLPESLVPLAGRLIRATQANVGARYRTPNRLLAQMIALGPDRTVFLGCWLGDELLAVGAFLRFAGQVVYVLNGWRREYAKLAPTYPLVHEALSVCGAMGDALMDLGHSPRPGLAAYKRKWGGEPGTFLFLDAAAIGQP